MATNVNTKAKMMPDGETATAIPALAPRAAAKATVASGAVTAALEGGIYRLYASAETTVRISSGDTATAADFTLPGGFVEYVRVHPDQTLSSFGGTLEYCICD